MKIQNAESITAAAVRAEDAADVKIRVLIGPADGAPNFCMRQFTVEPGGHTPYHAHDWEHEVYVLAGSGVVPTAEGDHPIAAGDCVYVAPGEIHQFKNTGQGQLKIICLVPKSGHK